MSFDRCQTCNRSVGIGSWHACNICGSTRHAQCPKSCACRCEEWHFMNYVPSRCIASACRNKPMKPTCSIDCDTPLKSLQNSSVHSELTPALCQSCSKALKTLINKRTLETPSGFPYETLYETLTNAFFATLGACETLSRITRATFEDAVENADTIESDGRIIHKYHGLVNKILKVDAPVEISSEAIEAVTGESWGLNDEGSIPKFKAFLRDFSARLNICIINNCRGKRGFFVCPASAYNINDIITLELRLRSAGFRGMPLRDILSEYDNAWKDIKTLEASGKVWRADFSGVFHSSAVIPQNPISRTILSSLANVHPQTIAHSSN